MSAPAVAALVYLLDQSFDGNEEHSPLGNLGSVSVLIMHDVYYAGEINHRRALRQDDDRWPWETR